MLTKIGLALVLSTNSAIAWRAPLSCSLSSADAVKEKIPFALAALSDMREELLQESLDAEKSESAGLLDTKPFACRANRAIAARNERANIFLVFRWMVPRRFSFYRRGSQF